MDLGVLKMQGGDYMKSIEGKRMRRRDYEMGNLSMDGSRLIGDYSREIMQR